MTEPRIVVPPVVQPLVVEAPKAEEKPEEKAPKETPKVEVATIPAKKSRVQEICEEMGAIIAEHGGLVSNIPVNKQHPYWALKAELDALSRTA